MNRFIDHIKDLIDQLEIEKGVKPHVIYLGRDEFLIAKASGSHLLTILDGDRRELMGIELVLVDKQNYVKVY